MTIDETLLFRMSALPDDLKNQSRMVWEQAIKNAENEQTRRINLEMQKEEL